MVASVRSIGIPDPAVKEISSPADGSAITLPSEELLLGGDYSRVGTDLVVSHPDHGQVLVPGYFSGDEFAALRLENGALLTGETVARLAGPLAPGQYAQVGGGAPGTPIGTVDSAGGTVTATRTNGSTVTLASGDPVFQGDVLQTGSGGNLSIIFIDDTVFTLSADARMVLDELVYSPGGSNNSMVMNLVQGTFIFVTGQVAPTGDMRVDTPTAVLGIRGTTPVVTIDAGGAGTYSLAPDPNGDIGSYQIFDRATGQLIGTVNTISEYVQIAGVGVPPITLPKSQSDISSEQSQLQQAYGSSRRTTGDQNGQDSGGEDPGNPEAVNPGGLRQPLPPNGGNGTDGNGGQAGGGNRQGLNLLDPGSPRPPAGPPDPPPVPVQQSNPTALNLNFSVDEDGTLNAVFLGFDPDRGDFLRFEPIGALPELLEISANGAWFSYSPASVYAYLNTGETATETFQYKAIDSTGLTSAPATVTITINGVGGYMALSAEAAPLYPGDTVYGFNTTEAGTQFDFTGNPTPNVTIEDSAGNDTLDLSGYALASAIDLTPGAFSSANGQTDNIQIALGTDIENAVGGTGNDTLNGNSLDNRLDGGPGLDTLTGGAGTDTFVLSHTDAADIITDFDLSADRLDISALVDAFFDPANPSDYIQGSSDGTDITITVDQDGAGTDHAPETVAVLQGASAGPGSTIDFVFSGNAAQVTETFIA